MTPPPGGVERRAEERRNGWPPRHLSERTWVSVGLMATLVTGAITVALVVGRDRGRIDTLERRMAEELVRVPISHADMETRARLYTDQRIAELIAKIDEANRRLERIEKRLP